MFEKILTFLLVLTSIKGCVLSVNDKQVRQLRKSGVAIRKHDFNDIMGLLFTVHRHEKDDQSDCAMLKDTIVDLTKSISNINVLVKQIHDDLQKVTTEKDTMKAAIDKITIMNNDQSKKMDDLEMYMSTSIKDQSKKMDDLKMYMSTSIKDITTHLETVDNSFNVCISNISTQQVIIHKNICNNTELPQKDPPLSWPAGDYSIPEPDTGCPNTTDSTWEPSSYRISTAPNNNNDTHSSNLNLAGSVFEKINNNNYFTMKLCTMTGCGHGQVWPAGSYCVQMYIRIYYRERDCPSGLSFGWIRYGRFNDNSEDVFNNLPRRDRWNSKTQSYVVYCCRDDGSPTNPIILPSLKPFYLYRYGGICQEVVGMEVSNQWIHTDTGKWGKTDHYGPYIVRKGMKGTYENIPDGSVTNGVTTHICYYTPRN